MYVALFTAAGCHHCLVCVSLCVSCDTVVMCMAYDVVNKQSVIRGNHYMETVGVVYTHKQRTRGYTETERERKGERHVYLITTQTSNLGHTHTVHHTHSHSHTHTRVVQYIATHAHGTVRVQSTCTCTQIHNITCTHSLVQIIII